MENKIKLYAKHRGILLESQQKAIKELVFIQDEDSLMDDETRAFMTDVMNYITYISSCVEVIDCNMRMLVE